MRALSRCAMCSSTCLILVQRSALSCSPSAIMPVLPRLRAMRPSNFAPCARYRCSLSDKGGRKAGAVNGLDAAHGEMLVEIEIDRAHSCLIGHELFCDFRRRLELLFDGGMQPAAIPRVDQGRAAHLEASGQIACERVHLEPGPAGAGPDFEQDAVRTALFPLARL